MLWRLFAAARVTHRRAAMVFIGASLGVSVSATAPPRKPPATKVEEQGAIDKKTGYPRGHVSRPDLPFFTIDQIKTHDSHDAGMWVTYKGGVYDITEFYKGHPGGDGRLAMAAGNDVAIFWDVYRQHYQPHVLDFLEKFRIGNVTVSDAIKMETEFEFADPYADDPRRPNPDFLHTTEKPFCGEAEAERLADSFYTPNDLHYVRLHMPVPEMTAKDWRLVIEGNDASKVKTTEFSLDEIKKKFKPHTLACTLQCAGNRRQDFQDLEGHNMFFAPQWRVAAFSNAKYTGVYLRDVLESCGLDVNGLHTAELPHPQIRHLQIEGTDATEDGVNYGVSIPIEKAVDPRGDVMIVWEMNGQPLPKDHGGPVRLLVPGHVGNKSAKFLERLRVSDEESSKSWHWKSYRNFPPDVTFEKDLYKWDKVTPAQLEKAPICQLMPVQSLITYPPPDAVLGGKIDKLKVKGVAWSGNGIGLARVDVSLDGGKNFTAADFLPKPEDVQARETWHRKWSWSLFEKEIPIPENIKQKMAKGEKVTFDLVSKGVDNQFNVQPSEVLPYYNSRGVVINSWYHVPCEVDPKAPLGTIARLAKDYNPPTGGHCIKPFNEHGWTSEEGRWHEEIVAAAKKKK